MNNIQISSSEFNVSISQINNRRLSVASADNLMDGRWWISRINVQGVKKRKRCWYNAIKTTY